MSFTTNQVIGLTSEGAGSCTKDQSLGVTGMLKLTSMVHVMAYIWTIYWHEITNVLLHSSLFAFRSSVTLCMLTTVPEARYTMSGKRRSSLSPTHNRTRSKSNPRFTSGSDAIT